MTQAVTLLLGVHAHQPVGNFPEVIEDAHLRCYKPFIETLHAYQEFRFAAHFSGWLLDWLRERYPAEEFQSRVTGPCEVKIVPNCDHFYNGCEDKVATIVSSWLARALKLPSA